jgi:hypothetical protein
MTVAAPALLRVAYLPRGLLEVLSTDDELM